MKKIIEELTTLGDEISKAKTSVAELTGQKTEIVKRIKEEFGVTTVPELEKLLTKETANKDKLEEEIISEFEALKGSFQW